MRSAFGSLHVRRGSVLCGVVACVLLASSGTGLASPTSLSADSALHVARRSTVSLGSAIPGCGSSADFNNAQAAADPADPSRLVVSYSAGDGLARFAATSGDGGTTWSSRVLPGLTACTGNPAGGSAGDPFLAVGRDGRVYSSASWVNFDPGPVARTGRDVARGYVSAAAWGGGFEQPVEVDPLVSAQRVQLLADPEVPGRVTAFYQHASDVAASDPVGGSALPLPGDALYVRTSVDGGRTFGVPSLVAVPLPGHAHVTLGLVRSGSTLVAVRADVDLAAYAAGLATAQAGLAEPAPTPEALYAHRSTDGGLTWSDGAYIGTYTLGGGAGFAIPDVASGPEGDVYVTWPEGSGPSMVRVARSRDGGQSWSTTTAATVAGVAFEPSVAVRADGHAAVAFYELTGDVLSERAAATTDGAASWSPAASFAPDVSYSALSGSTDGSAVGPFQDLVALPDGYGAAFTTLARGHAAVVYSRLVERR